MMIDEDRTLSVFGTNVKSLTDGSNKRVVAVCESCGKIRVVRYRDHCVLCRLCAQKKKTFSDAHRRNLSNAGRGRVCSDETRCKISTVHKGKTISEEHRCKIAKANAKRVVTDETRCKMSKSRKGKTQLEETLRKRSATRQGITYDEWESFATAQPYCPKFNGVCRDSNRKKYNYTCFLCGKPQVENTTKLGTVRKLSVHHVDMQKLQGCGHDWKLVPLCMACHGMAHTTTMASRIEYVLQLGGKNVN